MIHHQFIAFIITFVYVYFLKTGDKGTLATSFWYKVIPFEHADIIYFLLCIFIPVLLGLLRYRLLEQKML